jgi:uncharacterized membrane protein YphA (DoxX/SURF4 family)
VIPWQEIARRMILWLIRIRTEAVSVTGRSEPAKPLVETFDRIDARITRVLARIGVPAVRIGLGVVFLWFGVLKFFPDLSPAADLATRTIERLTFGVVTAELALPLLAAWETLIGIGLLSGRFLRATLLLLAVQMAGTVTPLILFPAEAFTQFPIAPTLEGQYIIKNLVLIGAAMVVGATVRGGGLVAEPPSRPTEGSGR